MLDRKKVEDEVAGMKKDARRRFDAALTALLALAWRYKDSLGAAFRFEDDPDLYAEALAICRQMSDDCIEDAKHRLEAISDEIDADEALSFSDGEPLRDRFDMAGSHLILLADLWVSTAFAKGFTQDYTRIAIGRYINSPMASGLFHGADTSLLKWGRGYAKNIPEQMGLIGQDAIVGAARVWEWQDEAAKGATYYIRHRGSAYDCDVCDEMCEVPTPIEIPITIPHARCMCWTEYFYENAEQTL